MVLGWLTIAALPARAAETPAIHFDSGLVTWGKTLSLTNGASVAIFPGILPGEADVTWTKSEAAVPPISTTAAVSGSAYRLTITGVAGLVTGAKPAVVILPAGSGYWNRRIWMYDLSTQLWSTLPTSSRAGGFLQAPTTSLNAIYVVLEDHTGEIGYASWYCKNFCSKKYPTLHGTSNEFPIGSYVLVTSAETKKSVKVKIISTWGQPAGRVIDLSWAAYSALKTTNKGVTKVTVTPSTATAPIPTTVVKVTTESLPKFKVTQTTVMAVPKVSAKSYVVYDQGSGTVLASTLPTQVAPIASLTKLTTAMVALDKGVSMAKVMTYTKADVTPYAYLQVKLGETLTVKDLFYSMIVGSANNAATGLARSTGLSRAAFVQAMNAKVASWGLTNTHFVDVNGLDPQNVSTASDLAVIAGHAFHDYPQLRAATLVKAYTFTTINTKHTHTIKSTDKLLLAGTSGLTITGGKTGFLDEAQYTYVLRTTNKQGAQVVTVILGDPTSASRFNDAAQLATWAWKSYQWS